MVTIIIPARNEKFMPNTVNDLLKNARGEIEIIVILDGYYPDVMPKSDPRVHFIHKGEAEGMRPGINSAVAIAKGEHIMKIDGHCMVDEGFDVKLAADCEKNWVVIPRRKRLDADNWCIQDVGKPDIDYEFMSFPDDPADFGGAGLNGRIWTQRILERKDDPKYDIDDNMSFQGSCWFMHKDYFHELELMDWKKYGTFWNEAQEIGLKAWLSGGAVKVNKKTWYAHLHKGKKHGRGYKISKRTIEQGAMFGNKWLDNKAWGKQTLPFSTVIEHFWPIPGWTDDWKEKLAKVGLRSDDLHGKMDTLDYILNKYGHSKDEQFIQLPGKREDLAKLFGELGFKEGAEIGVEQGKFSEVLCQRVEGVKLHSIDAWTAYKGYREHVSQDKVDNLLERARERLQPYNVNIIKGFSTDVAKTFKDESLDFVYIDGNHEFTHVANDLGAWIPKVKKGGIVAGHDFVRSKGRFGKGYYHVKDVIQAWTYSHGIRPYFIFKDEKSPSWFFVKE